VIVMTLSSFAASAQLNPTISLFVHPVTNEFGWTRSVFTGATSIGTILGGLMALVVGPVIDRHGARWLLTAAFLMMGALLISLGSMHSLWHFYLVFILSRMILQGIIQLANNVVIAKWFIAKRGRALAISSVGQRIGLGVIPVFVQFLMSGYGWRMAAVGLGSLTWGLTIVPTVLWLRRNPEDLGLNPDGDPGAFEDGPDKGSSQDEPPQSSRLNEFSFTLREALQTRSFYVLLAALCIGNFVNTGVNFHMYPLLTDRGFSPGLAVAIVSTWSLVGIPMVTLGGILAERVAIRFLMAGAFLGMGLSVVILLFADTVLTGFLFAVVYGTFFGISLLYQNLSLANYYGRDSFGAIRGFTSPFQMVTNALGPFAAAFVFDTTGSYSAILIAHVFLLLLVAGAMIFATPPRRIVMRDS